MSVKQKDGHLVVDMILFCPQCGMQHIDEPEDERIENVRAGGEVVDSVIVGWTNPPHRTHQCQRCRHQWRPSDTHTNGVAEISSKGVLDNTPPIRQQSFAEMPLYPKCAVCGTTAGLQDEGWHGFRCSSPTCQVL